MHLLTRSGLDGSGFEPRWGKRFFSTPFQFSGALRPTQLPVQWIAGLFPLGENDTYVALVIHPPSDTEVKNK